MPATRLAAKSPMMPLARSWLRPATGPATEPVRARAEEARGGPRTHHPARGRPLPAPATASAAAPTTSAGYTFPTTLTVACSALEAQAPTVPPARPCRWSRCGFGESSRGGLRGQGSGQVERGDTIADSWASQAAKAAAAPCSSSGNVHRWSHIAETQ